MNESISRTEKMVKEVFRDDSTGHDWFHTERVRNVAVQLAEMEGGNAFVCEMAALLHDVADEKFNENEEAGINRVKEWLLDLHIEEELIREIMNCISTVSYKGGNNKAPTSLEGKIVQDADRLDAIGAIGVARCFMYAGATKGKMHDPEMKPRESMTKEEYRKKEGTAINHFYEKLLKLKKLMNTSSGKKLADERHEYMNTFLEQFFQEWEGKR
ncbi:HD domain-containing protein [Evansella cellulosilytica]|uniref:Metal dependent phosphohydrolase n=1 Tax=Evansella cellulosilytica (strain ATCC 21833 / DSM 2522 / FERM P-1141 / JCM 9156 / N-4) TaxID=649639 RepID=E6U261_EVAC2|nr:HD domain-containing protein [Evansella cellulosilytica]ADU30439.1 metal dependent phosphohydrolase [Evansella cellulosilytica DSM 2522]